MAHIFNSIFDRLFRNRGGKNGAQIMRNAAVGIVAILIVATSVFFIQKAIETRVAIAREKLILLQTVEARQNIFTALGNDYKRLAPVFPSVYAIFPHAEDALSFSGEMEKMAEETGNTISFEISTGEPPPDSEFPELKQVSFTAELSGNGDSFERFLKRVRVSRYVSQINAINVESAGGISGAGKMRITGAMFIQ